VMVSPRYPRRAVQEAREGNAVVCFLVDQSGAVQDPVIVEISDDIFAPTTLGAITRSRYRPTASTSMPRPGCRAYTYTLEMIRD
jgi:protein TonB